MGGFGTSQAPRCDPFTGYYPMAAEVDALMEDPRANLAHNIARARRAEKELAEMHDFLRTLKGLLRDA